MSQRGPLKIISIVGSIRLLSGAPAMAVDGMTTIPSSFGARQTADRLEADIKARGMTVFARASIMLRGPPKRDCRCRRPELLIFGNAKAGTPLMQATPTAGIDLPLKALVYEDSHGKVWLSYNDPVWVAKRHGVGDAVAGSVNAMAHALDAIASGRATKLP